MAQDVEKANSLKSAQSLIHVMDREKAVSVIKEIFDKCGSIEGKSIKLMTPNANNVLSKGCQIHIETNDNEFMHSCITRIADDNCLAVQQEDNFLVIYKPQ